jgi:ligand-binding SRPBCC domain-containing protein
MDNNMKIARSDDGTYALQTSQWIPAPVGDVFGFFSEAANLELLTPPFLNFRILTPTPVEMCEGRRIEYQLKLHGIPLRWTSEITLWHPPHAFVDEQLRGPYRTWRHEHRFEARDDGTLVHDNIRYAVPGGAAINRLFVEPDVRRIFTYRQQQMAELFPARAPAEQVPS